MIEKSNRLFVSIAVSHPEGELAELPGAITASERMATWAGANGYRTVLINDQIYPKVTVELLRGLFVKAIGQIVDEDGLELDRLVVFFAGHGSAGGIGDQRWILSDWQSDASEAVRLINFQRMLEYYGPRQVAIIGDACQEYSPKFLDLVGSAVLRKSSEAPQDYELDQFLAVDVGKQAFMIKATDGKGAFCIFTEVLLDALEGEVNDAHIEQIGGKRCITSQTLAKHLKANVEREASRYGVRMLPRPMPGFYTDRTYLSIPDSVSGGPSNPPSSGAIPPPRRFVDLIKDDALASVGDDTDFMERVGHPNGSGSVFSRVIRKVKLKLPSSKHDSTAVSRALQGARQRKFEEYRRAQKKYSDVTVPYNAGAIALHGENITQIFLSRGKSTYAPKLQSVVIVDFSEIADLPQHLAWADALVKMRNGNVLSICTCQGFTTDVTFVNKAEPTVVHRPAGYGAELPDFALDALAKAHAGELEEEDIINIAAFQRRSKHQILTMGCIAAQFYDVIRDVQSLRSMAAFYARFCQPVPLDIVLYGGGTIFEEDGQLYADIPQVPDRRPRTEDERGIAFTHMGTPAIKKHPIAGRVPWMSQAWGAAATARCHPSADRWQQQCEKTMRHLAPGAFSTIRPEGRSSLIELATISSAEKDPTPTRRTRAAL